MNARWSGLMLLLVPLVLVACLAASRSGAAPCASDSDCCGTACVRMR
jgi:hypothetical protein